jgi:hypothetical protein
MNSVFRKSGYLTALAVVFFASASFAQTTTKITITGVGDGANLDGAYVDPYNAVIGTGSSAVSTYAICDDWSDNTSVGQSWTANVYNLATAGNSSNGNPLFGNNQGLYNELAWLGTQLLANPMNTANQDVISFAMWELTWSSYPYAPEAPPSIGSEQQAVTAELNLANTHTNFNGSGWEILTPTPGGPGEPQEFLVYTPESSAVVLFGADMFGLLGLAFVFRRRMLRPIV